MSGSVTGNKKSAASRTFFRYQKIDAAIAGLQGSYKFAVS
jgi:hypothetical protein